MKDRALQQLTRARLNSATLQLEMDTTQMPGEEVRLTPTQALMVLIICIGGRGGKNKW